MSLEEDILEQFDAYIQEQGYSNRSEVIRALIRKGLIALRGVKGGTLTMSGTGGTLH
ncbi:MAG TPA: ribbon-helix-helix protein, CopG family [Desulfobacteraceae bacterium]|nr:ribbon-helix-helix protein, CopG family [Desulfobacteraceae bacterium]